MTAPSPEDAFHARFAPTPPKRPRDLILACLALCVGPVLRTQHAPPLTLPAVPYAVPG